MISFKNILEYGLACSCKALGKDNPLKEINDFLREIIYIIGIIT